MFRHHPDGIIYINNLAISLADFLLDEPAYTLPAGIISREYVPGVKHVLSDGSSQSVGPMPWPEGDGYLSRIAVYTARQFPAATLATTKTAKSAEVGAFRDAACFAPVMALGRTWQADQRSQDLLGQSISLATAGLPLPPVWRDINNSDMPVATLADLLAIAGAMALQTQAAYAKSWALKATVAAATTIAQVESVTW